MGVSSSDRFMRLRTIRLCIPILLGPVCAAAAAEADPAAFQGAWLEQSLPCDGVYTAAGKGMSFKKPVNIFAPAFIVSGSRLRTPQATCRIRSVRPMGDREVMRIDCANSVATGDVAVQVSASPDGTLRRFFNEDDKTGNVYRRCDR